jgi:hypothetical protein
MGPLLGSARNSPLMKRKSKSKSPAAPSSLSPESPHLQDKDKETNTAKAMKLLGIDEAQQAPALSSPTPAHSQVFVFSLFCFFLLQSMAFVVVLMYISFTLFL